MQSKILSKRVLLICALAAFVFFAALLFYFIRKQSISSDIEKVVVTNQEFIVAELPVRLKIPVINIDAAIEYVGVTSDGAMDVPKGPADVAWYNLGPRPGEIGSAALAGHFGWKYGSVFDNLNKLHPGDKLYIEDGRGGITTFVVRESRSYDPKSDATDVFISTDGKAHLNLITCEGVWDKVIKSYSKRLVVFTDKL